MLIKAEQVERAQELFQSIRIDELDEFLATADISVFPKTTLEPPSDWTKNDVSNVFLPGFRIEASPRHINYILSFISLISDPKVGLRRVFKCLHCGRIGIGRPNQKFCHETRGMKNCRVCWHYAQNPDRKKQQIRKWRKKYPGMG